MHCGKEETRDNESGLVGSDEVDTVEIKVSLLHIFFASK